MGKIKDLTGQKFGRLTAIKMAELDKWGQAKWLCECDCGNLVNIKSGNLRSGHTQSCGCLWGEAISKSNTTHGKRKTRIYRIYHHMKERCYCENDKSYKNYEWCIQKFKT